ncbi:MAG: TraC family protein [Aquificaceae bacterium]
MTTREFYEILERENLSRYLMPLYEEDGIFFLRDDGVGIGFECVPTVGVSKKIESGLRTFLNAVPEGASVQFILWGGSDILDYVDYWLSNKARHIGNLRGLDAGLILDMAKSYAEFLERKRKEKITRSWLCTAKNFRLFVFVKLGGKEKEYGLFDKVFSFFRGQNSEVVESLQDRVRTIASIRERLKGALESAFLFPKPLKAQDMVEFLYKWLNPSKDWRAIPVYDGTIPISRAVIHADTKVEVFENYIRVDGLYMRGLSVKSYPEEFSHGNVYEYVGDILMGSDYDFDYWIVLNAIKLPEKEKGKVKRDATIVLSQQVPYSLVPRLKFKHKDLSYAMERLERGADLWLVDFLFLVSSWSKEDLELKVSRAKAGFRRLGFILEEDRYINLADFLSLLPFGFDLRMAGFLSRQRVRAVFEENVASLAPVYGGYKGTLPEFFLFATNGQLVGLDLFKAQVYHGFVVGMSGAGKSVFMQYLTLNYLMSGNRVWIIDIGRSYERLCKIVGGDFIELRLDNPMCINPFSQIENFAMLEDYLEFLINLLYLMGAVKEPTRALEEEKLIRAYLEEAIKEVWTKYGRDTDVDAIVEYLKKYINDPRIADFVRQLSPYTSTGQYGKFFNGYSTLRFDKFLTVLENDTLENIPDLRDPAIMILFFHISKEVYLQQSDYHHVVIIDEAHKFMGNPRIDLFIEQAYRRFRKHNASIILGTQGFEDFVSSGGGVNKVGKIVIDNSYWSMFMMQTPASLNALKQSGRFTLSDFEWELMASCKNVGEFSEVFLFTQDGTVKLRVVLNEFMKAMFFTDPQTRSRIKALLEQGYSYLDAVKKVQEELR